MEDEDHDGWMDFEGRPAAIKRPPTTVVNAPPGVRLTAEQSSAIGHEFRIFTRIVNNSSIPNGWHTHHAELPDGTRAEFQAMQGEFTTHVWPAGGSKPLPPYRGFVIKPKLEAGAPSDWNGSTALLTVVEEQWRKWVKPYSPGKANTPTYFVDSIRSRPARGVQEEQPWFDVYLWAGASLFFNGLAAGTLPGNVRGPLIVLRQPDAVTLPKRVAFTASAEALYRVAADLNPPTTLYTHAPFFAPSTEVLTPAARPLPTAERIDLLALGKTLAGALQVRRAELTLLRAPPWFSAATVSAQLDVPGILVPTGGYTSSDTYEPGAPYFPIKDANALICGWRWPRGPTSGGATSFGSYIRGSSVGTTGTRSRSNYAKTISSSANVQLYSDLTATLNRQLSISSQNEGGNVGWSVRWPGPTVWTAASNPGSAGEAGAYSLFQSPPNDIDSSGIYTNYLVSQALLEIGGRLDHSDSTTSVTTIGGLGAMYSVGTTHTVVHTESETYEYVSDDPGGPRNVGYKGYYDFAVSPDFIELSWDAYVVCTKTPTAGIYYDVRTEVLTVAGATRDYVLIDTKNSVFLWLEATMSGTVTTTTNAGDVTVSGGATLSVRLKLSTPMGEFQGNTISINENGVHAELVPPADIAFGATNRTWRHVMPKQGMPIFTPLWYGQGPCQYIAYTTADERAASVADRLLASFRMQLVLAGRPIDAEPPAPITGATTFQPRMMEQMVANHWSGSYFTGLNALEAQALTLHATYPGPDVHDNIDIVGADPLSEFYRS